MKYVFKPLTKICLIPYRLTALAARDASIEEKKNKK